MVQSNFNTYIDGINADFWRELCLNNGEQRTMHRGDTFVCAGEVARYIGYIKNGTFKYVAMSDDGTEHVVGLEFTGEFVADFPFSLYNIPARVSIIAETTCELYCVKTSELLDMIKDRPEMAEIVMHATEAIFSTVYDRYVAYTQSRPNSGILTLSTAIPTYSHCFHLKISPHFSTSLRPI